MVVLAHPDIDYIEKKAFHTERAMASISLSSDSLLCAMMDWQVENSQLTEVPATDRACLNVCQFCCFVSMASIFPHLASVAPLLTQPAWTAVSSAADPRLCVYGLHVPTPCLSRLTRTWGQVKVETLWLGSAVVMPTEFLIWPCLTHRLLFLCLRKGFLDSLNSAKSSVTPSCPLSDLGT